MQKEGISPNQITFISLLKACGSICAIEKGEQIRGEIASRGFLKTNAVLGNALVDMYAKCGMVEKAHTVLKELPVRDVVSWCTLICGYAQQRKCPQALDCFDQMKSEGLFPDDITFACVLKACGSAGDIENGERIHDEILTSGLLDTNAFLGTALVDMYAKCGSLAKSQAVHEELHCKDVVAWNALIVGYVKQGKGFEALRCFRQMHIEGVNPDSITFDAILKACGHSRHGQLFS
jgi:pentatricopeptide repeat protein